MTAENTITCNDCLKMECRKGFSDGIPVWCATRRFQDIIDETKTDYSAPNNQDIYQAANKIVTSGYGKWPRIQEAVEFARELKVNKIGLASCLSLISELSLVARLFSGAGFEVVSSACKIGGIFPEDSGPDGKAHHFSCNPIAQAEICNRAGTQLNFILGLCLGHDILFTRYSKAPASVLIVKDRVTGHNPAAVLYAEHPRTALFNQYCKGKNSDFNS
jgi:uncharacterized metal-binding protein